MPVPRFTNAISICGVSLYLAEFVGLFALVFRLSLKTGRTGRLSAVVSPQIDAGIPGACS